MENIHEWINSAALALVFVAFFLQSSILKNLQTALKAINIDEIYKSQTLLLKIKEEEYKAFGNEQLRKGIKASSKTFQKVNRDFIEKYNELQDFHVQKLLTMDYAEREKYLLKFPKTKSQFESLLFELDLKIHSGLPDSNGETNS